MYSKMRNNLYSQLKDLVKQSIATFTPWKCLNWKGNKPKYEARSSLIGRFSELYTSKFKHFHGVKVAILCLTKSLC